MSSFEPGQFEVFEFGPIERTGPTVRLHYRLVGEQTLDFTEEFRFPQLAGSDPVRFDPVTEAAFLRLGRLLLLAVGLSYYKAAAPRRMRLVGGWAVEEVEFLRQLVTHGLGEFAYTNDLPEVLDPQITADEIVPLVAPERPDLDPNAAFTPVGGGKDSCVTIEALRGRGVSQTLFAVNHYVPIQDVAAVAQLPLLTVERSLDPLLFELNASGARNGHVPVTAINSLTALMAAVLSGASAVVMSNERSASEENLTWAGHSINHQWSKSLAFERLLRGLVARTVVGLDYFSLLRQYSELRIAENFAELTRYHPVFASCGRAFVRTGMRQRWCGECAKCRFVSLILAPHLTPEQLWGVFGRDLFVGPVDDFALLAGIGGTKPLDCVGEVAETRLAIELTARAPQWADNEFIARLRAALPAEGMPGPEQIQRLLTADTESAVPPALAAILDGR